MNNFYFLLLLFSDFIGILFSFSFLLDDEEAHDLSDIENTAFYSFPSFILTLLYPYRKSIFVNTFFFTMLSIKSEISGNG